MSKELIALLEQAAEEGRSGDIYVGMMTAAKAMSPLPEQWIHDDGRTIHSSPAQENCPVCSLILEERLASSVEGYLVDESHIQETVDSLPNAIARSVDENGSLRTTAERVSALLSDGRRRSAMEICHLLQLSEGSVRVALKEVGQRVRQGSRAGSGLWRLKNPKTTDPQ